MTLIEYIDLMLWGILLGVAVIYMFTGRVFEALVLVCFLVILSKINVIFKRKK